MRDYRRRLLDSLVVSICQDIAGDHHDKKHGDRCGRRAERGQPSQESVDPTCFFDILVSHVFRTELERSGRLGIGQGLYKRGRRSKTLQFLATDFAVRKVR